MSQSGCRELLGSVKDCGELYYKEELVLLASLCVNSPTSDHLFPAQMCLLRPTRCILSLSHACIELNLVFLIQNYLNKAYQSGIVRLANE